MYLPFNLRLFLLGLWQLSTIQDHIKILPSRLNSGFLFPTIVKFLKNTCCMYCMLFTNFSWSGTSVICPISSRSSSDISPCSCKKKWLSNDKLLPVPVHGFPSSLSIKFHQISYHFQVSYHIFSYTFIVVFPILHWQKYCYRWLWSCSPVPDPGRNKPHFHYRLPLQWNSSSLHNRTSGK